MKKFMFLTVLFLFPLLAYPADPVFEVLVDLALQGQQQKTGFYLNSKSCLTSIKGSLHVAYDQKKDILIFGYYTSSTGMVKNYVWDRKEGKTSIISCKFDEQIDSKNAIKVSEREIQDSALKFRTDWLSCK